MGLDRIRSKPTKCHVVRVGLQVDAPPLVSEVDWGQRNRGETLIGRRAGNGLFFLLYFPVVIQDDPVYVQVSPRLLLVQHVEIVEQIAKTDGLNSSVGEDQGMVEELMQIVANY